MKKNTYLKYLFSVIFIAIIYKMLLEYYRYSKLLVRDSGKKYSISLYSLGHYYKKEKNCKLAIKNYLQAAKKGNADAQNTLGELYLIGEIVKQDYKLAIYWFRKAAIQGDAAAQNNIGVLYATGKGVNQDYNLAIHWFRMSAKQGWSEAQYNMGLCYAKGIGVAKDHELEISWFGKSSRRGKKVSQKILLISSNVLKHSEKSTDEQWIRSWGFLGI